MQALCRWHSCGCQAEKRFPSRRETRPVGVDLLAYGAVEKQRKTPCNTPANWSFTLADGWEAGRLQMVINDRSAPLKGRFWGTGFHPSPLAARGAISVPRERAQPTTNNAVSDAR